ncbi:MAG: histidine kinase [Flammeovirgaceae bacterium]
MHIKETKKANDFLLSIMSNAPYGIIALDWDGTIVMVNQKARQFMDITPQVPQLVEQDIRHFIAHIPELHQQVCQCLEKGFEPFDLDAIPFQERFYNVKGRAMKNGFILTIEDISNIKEMEAEAITSMLEGQELERKRLAREIHDGVGPMLSTVKHHLESIRTEVHTDKRLREKFDRISDLIDNLATEMRDISHALMPKALMDFGVVSALQNFTEKLSNKKVNIQFMHMGMNERLPQLVELGLYRIAQELVGNALKHAQASEINLQLIRHAHSVVLIVEDDGIGFDLAKLAGNDGIGLQNVETRAQSLGGICDVDAGQGIGVTVTVDIPI